MHEPPILINITIALGVAFVGGLLAQRLKLPPLVGYLLAGVAIVLSGMGDDGAEGAAAVQRRGGLAIALDEQSSAVFGMPRAAIERGVREVLSTDEIPARLLALRYRPIPGSAR